MIKKLLENIVSEEIQRLDEKLITFSNRANYGQVVFMAGGAGCFDKDTLVETDIGYEKISNIEEGDLVYSFNEDTKEKKLTRVNETYKWELNELAGSQDIIELEFDNGITVQCTEQHEFYVGGKWVEARNLEIGTEF